MLSNLFQNNYEIKDKIILGVVYTVISRQHYFGKLGGTVGKVTSWSILIIILFTGNASLAGQRLNASLKHFRILS